LLGADGCDGSGLLNHPTASTHLLEIHHERTEQASGDLWCDRKGKVKPSFERRLETHRKTQGAGSLVPGEAHICHDFLDWHVLSS
jgi:hypothetical protein